MEKLSNEVKNLRYYGEYDHEDKRRVVRNRILYSIPYTGKWWGNFRHKATEARRRNLQKLKGAAVQGKKTRVVKKRHHQRKLQASTVGVESNLGIFMSSAVVAGKKDGASSENDKREVHANTYEVNSIIPDGLNKVTRQVEDVVSTTVSSAEAHSSQTKAVGKKLVAQKRKSQISTRSKKFSSNQVMTNESGERLQKSDEDSVSDDDSEDQDNSDDDEDEKPRKAGADDEGNTNDDQNDDTETGNDKESEDTDKERKAASNSDDETGETEQTDKSDEKDKSDNGSDNDSDSDEEIRELVSEDIKKISRRKGTRNWSGNLERVASASM